jgi:hypothetical protein
MTNGPGTYICIANNTSTATVLNSLAILTGAPSTATVALLSAFSGVVGVVTAGAGVTGSATIQQSGTASCSFDGATTANDAVIPSSLTADDCSEAGSASAGNSIGTVLSTNGAAGTYTVLLTPISVGARTICASGTAALASASTTSPQPVSTCQFSSGALNAVGKTFRMQAGIVLSPAGGPLRSNGSFCCIRLRARRDRRAPPMCSPSRLWSNKRSSRLWA